MAAYTTIDDPEKYFQCRAYTGNGADGHAITFDGDSDLSPNLLWFKGRAAPDSGSAAHRLLDTVRGITQALPSHDTDGQFVESGDGISSVDTDGFTLQINSGNDYNSSSKTYVCWAWKESADAGFDILTYTGNNTTRTISHNLSAVPKVMIFKETSKNGGNWVVYHGANTSAPETDLLLLNNTNATADDDSAWNDTAPTSSVFTLGDGDGGGDNNEDGVTMIGYLWAEKQGYSKFGTYEGNNNASGPYIYLGFKPAWFMTKKSNGSKDWNIYDNKRSDSGGGNPNDQYLEANNNGAEQSGQDVDFLSTGVKIRSTSSEVNGDDNTFIYMAFAESPLANSNGVPCNAE
tara:strand:- start:45 stop:1085 length:1041 start_codon:yes stop_codon:yes gene_type:complete